MPAQPGDDAGTLGDQVFTMINQQPQLTLHAFEARGRQIRLPQRGHADNNRKPHCDRFALAELQHERRCDQDDRNGIIYQIGVDRPGNETERHR